MEQQPEVTRSVNLSAIFIPECIVSTETLSLKLIYNPPLINNPSIKYIWETKFLKIAEKFNFIILSSSFSYKSPIYTST